MEQAPTQTIPQLLKRLWAHISIRRRKQFGLLFVVMVITSFTEVISIGAIVPFLGVLTAPESLFTNPSMQPIVAWLDIDTPNELIVPLSLAFASAAMLAGIMRLLLLWLTTRLSFATGADLSFSIYRRTLYQPYAIHVSRNSSEVIAAISSKVSMAINLTIMPTLTVISASFMLGAILIALLAIDSFIALVSMAGFAAIYGVIVTFTRHRLLSNSQQVSKMSSQVIKSLQEGLGGIRDILIDGSQEIYGQFYRRADLPLRRAQGNNLFVSQSPRFAMEALGMVLIAGLALLLSGQSGGVAGAIPVLGALALGAQRMLPVLQQSYVAWSGIQGARASLQDTLELLEQPLPVYATQNACEAIRFSESVELEDISFRYTPDAPLVLNNLSLKISKGEQLGFIGVTGSGKSTLIDVIMGLLQPSNGSFKIDGVEITTRNHRSWQAHIAHVPQTIFLADTTLEENIAFGTPKNEIDKERVVMAAKSAQISEMIDSLPEKFQTFVGERGVRLSGGQRQRIGIARALYKQADVIIFDEATSALDNNTERAVMSTIENLTDDITILIIAHRLSTLKNCTKIVELEDGKISRSGTYSEIIRATL